MFIVDCFNIAIANVLEFYLSGFKGSTHIKFEQKQMREQLIKCMEKKYTFHNSPKDV